MKMKIEVEVPKGLDTKQLFTHVIDALGVNDNLTDKEYEFVKRLMVEVRCSEKEYTVKRYITFEQSKKVVAKCEKQAIEISKTSSWLSSSDFEAIERKYNMEFVDTENYSASETLEADF